MRNGFDTVLQVVQGNFGFTWPFALQDSSGAAVDLSGASSVTFNAQLDSDNTVQFNGAMVVTNPSGGLCSYTIAATDFIVTGTWNAQVVVTYSSTEILSFAGIQVLVTASIPIS